MSPESKQAPALPIFASTDPAPDIYRTVGDLETYAEAVDVRNGEWRGFDAVGRHIELTVEGGQIEVRAGSASAPGLLAEWLRSSQFLKTRRDEDWLSRASLPDLVAAFDFEEGAWREQRPLARLRRWITGVTSEDR